MLQFLRCNRPDLRHMSRLHSNNTVSLTLFQNGASRHGYIQPFGWVGSVFVITLHYGGKVDKAESPLG